MFGYCFSKWLDWKQMVIHTCIFIIFFCFDHIFLLHNPVALVYNRVCSVWVSVYVCYHYTLLHLTFIVTLFCCVLRRPSAAFTVISCYCYQLLPGINMSMAKYIRKSKLNVLSDHQNHVTYPKISSCGGCSVSSPVEGQVPVDPVVLQQYIACC